MNVRIVIPHYFCREIKKALRPILSSGDCGDSLKVRTGRLNVHKSNLKAFSDAESPAVNVAFAAHGFN